MVGTTTIGSMGVKPSSTLPLSAALQQQLAAPATRGAGPRGETLAHAGRIRLAELPLRCSMALLGPRGARLTP
jgi:hypothetical protein